jgi:hypothetical protein
MKEDVNVSRYKVVEDLVLDIVRLREESDLELRLTQPSLAGRDILMSCEPMFVVVCALFGFILQRERGRARAQTLGPWLMPSRRVEPRYRKAIEHVHFTIDLWTLHISPSDSQYLCSDTFTFPTI